MFARSILTSTVKSNLRYTQQSRLARTLTPKKVKPIKDWSSVPNQIAVVKHPYSLVDAPLPSCSPPEDKFAVFELSGTQYKVTLDDVIVTNHIEGLDIGQAIVSDSVLLIGSRKTTIVGAPLVTGAKVHLEVEEITKDKKVIVFKTRRRKNFRKKNGFRRHVTIFRIKDITVMEQHAQLM